MEPDAPLVASFLIPVSKDWPRRILEITSVEYSALFPVWTGVTEPPRDLVPRLDVTCVEDRWGNDILWRADGQIKGMGFSNNKFGCGSFTVYGPLAAFDLETLLGWFRSVAQNSAPHYGFIHAMTKAEALDSRLNYWGETSGLNTGLVPRHIKHGLPNLAWTCYFGSFLLSRMKTGSITDAPWSVCEPCGDGYTVQVTNRLYALDDYERFDEQRRACREHIDPSVFERSRPPPPGIGRFLDE